MSGRRPSDTGTGIITIRDVARTAGVSPATVSRVLSGRATVAPNLVERVQRAVAELGYRPNALARGLRRDRSSVWGMVISDIRNPFFTDVVRGVEDAAGQSGYSLILGDADEDVAKESAYIDLFIAQRVTGVIITPASHDRSDVSRLLKRLMPVVAVDRGLMSAEVDSVVVDNEGGSLAATRHLIEEGYSQIGCVTGPADRTPAIERLKGYMRAHELAGRVVDPRLIRHAVDFKQSGGFRATLELLSSARPPDALFVTNNLMTIGALEAIEQVGRVVPYELGLVAFDDMAWAPLLRPPLTCVAQPAYLIGQTASRLLLERILDPALPLRRIVLPTELHIRTSSLARARAGATQEAGSAPR